MFLDQLSDDQKRSFLAIATRMILADGDVAPEEDGDLAKIRETLGDGIIAPPEEVFGSTNADVFVGRTLRVMVVFEILLLAYSDEHLHVDESTVLDEICAALDVNEEDKATLSALAKRHVDDPSDAGVKGEVEALMG